MLEYAPTLADMMRLQRHHFRKALQSLNPRLRHEMVVARAQWDLPFFAEYFFPNTLRFPFNPVHNYLFKLRAVEMLDSPLQRKSGINVVLAPRGAAKTTILSLIEIAHAMLYGTEKFITLFAATQRQAEHRLANLLATFDTNTILQAHYALAMAGVRRKGDNSLTLGDCRLDVYSAGTEVRGVNNGAYRPTWIILDDVERSDHAIHSEHRRQTESWFDEIILPLGDSGTVIDLIGTLLHPEALPIYLAKKPGTTFMKFKSIITEADERGLWREWAEILNNLEDPERMSNALQFYQARKAAMDAGARVLWPERDSYYDLCVKREVMGRAAFDKERQNEPYADEQSPFTGFPLRQFSRVADMLRPADAGKETPWALTSRQKETDMVTLNDLKIYGFLDPALGGVKGDFAAITTIGVDGHGLVYVLDAWQARCSPSEQVKKIFELHEKWGYDAFGFEAVAFQAILQDVILNEMELRREAGKAWQLPFVKVVPKGTKAQRILALEPHLRNGWMLLSHDLDEDFMRQLLDYPNVTHDDLLDSLSQCVTLSGFSQRSSRCVEECAIVPSRSRVGRSF